MQVIAAIIGVIGVIGLVLFVFGFITTGLGTNNFRPGCLAIIIGFVMMTIAVGLAYATGAQDYLSPEGTMQRFCSTFDKGDYQTAYTFLSPRLQSEEDEQTFEQFFIKHHVTGCSLDTEYGTYRLYFPSSTDGIYSPTFQAILVLQGLGNWKIDQLIPD